MALIRDILLSVYDLTSSNCALPWSQIQNALRVLVVGIKLIITNDPLFNINVAQSCILLVFSCKVRHGHKALIGRVATECDNVFVLWIQDLEPTIDEDVLVFSTKL